MKKSDEEILRRFLSKKPKWDLIELLLSHAPAKDKAEMLEYVKAGGKP